MTSSAHKKTLFIMLILLSTLGFATSKPITPRDLFKHLSPTEPWDKGRLTATKTVNFQQSASAGTDSSIISKVTLTYFTSTDCSAAAGASAPTYTTPDGTSFTIIGIGRPIGTLFGLVASSVWEVANSKVSPAVADIENIQSIAVILKSTDHHVPQSDFSGNNFSCVAVTCSAGPSGECTSVAGTQTFELKTTAAVGDPADGGVIADVASGLIATASNNGSAVWGGAGTAIGLAAQSNSDGDGNTTAIVAALGTSSSYTARICDELSTAGGYAADWALPAKEQLNILYINRAAIDGFVPQWYASSTEDDNDANNQAWAQSFFSGNQVGRAKASSSYVRCIRTFTL